MSDGHPASDIDAAAIAAARITLAPVLRPTPAFRSDSLSRRFGTEIWLKPEFRQRTGSFKIRGAYLMQADHPPGTHVIAASAGNHAQGVALAASMLSQRATIHMPANASLPKVQATRAYGAEVVLDGATVDDCLVRARRQAHDEGALFVPPFDHPRIVLGQSTIGAELVDEVPSLANVVVAIGGGGLCGGVAAAIDALAPHVRVIGVAAAGADSMVASLAAGHPVEVSPRTIADGISLRAPSQFTVDLIGRHVDVIQVVSEESISAAMLLLLERAKSVVEPAGAAPLAAILEGADLADGPTALVLAGGNIDPLLLTKLVEFGLGVAGRYLAMSVVMDDQPGSLARLTSTVAALGLNVLDVEHHRTDRRLALGAVEVTLRVETRDHEHQGLVLAELRAAGFAVDPH